MKKGKQKKTIKNNKNQEELNVTKEVGQYDNELNKLANVKKSYFDTMNKVVETYLNQKYSKKGESNKSKQELNNKLKTLEKKKDKASYV